MDWMVEGSETQSQLRQDSVSLYLTGDWLAFARSPPVPPRYAQQSWATLALCG
jgi:hypothetical protein